MDVFDGRCSLRFSGEVSWDNLIHMLNSRYLQSSTQWLFLIVQYVFNLTVKILPYMQGPFPRLWSFLIFLTSKSMRWYVSLHFWSQNFVSGQMIWYIRHLWPALTRSCISSAIILTCIQALRDILELARRCVDVDQALGMCDLQQAGFSSKNKSKPNIFRGKISMGRNSFVIC
jgi:hypothetical protein